LDRATEVWEALLESSPENTDFRFELGISWYEKAVLYRAQRDIGHAVQAVETAIEHQKKAVAAAPEVVRYRDRLCGDHEVLGLYRMDAERFTEAREHFEQMRRLCPDDPRWLFRAASSLALCVHKIDLLGESATADQRILSDELAEVAVQWIRDAVDAGFRDVSAIETSPRLIAIRDRADYLQLIEDISQPSGSK
jgi:tetratricopeptide (TPR) repeat protein